MVDIAAVCEKHFEAHKSDCSGFAKAVATELGVTLTGQANAIVDTLKSGAGGWVVLADGKTAARTALTKLVIAGLRGDAQAVSVANGHVVVVVPGALAHGKYPTAYWGQLNSVGKKNQTINWAWTKDDRDKVVYAAHDIVTPPV
jgi:hypothetical protein